MSSRKSASPPRCHPDQERIPEASPHDVIPTRAQLLEGPYDACQPAAAQQRAFLPHAANTVPTYRINGSGCRKDPSRGFRRVRDDNNLKLHHTPKASRTVPRCHPDKRSPEASPHDVIPTRAQLLEGPYDACQPAAAQQRSPCRMPRRALYLTTFCSTTLNVFSIGLQLSGGVSSAGSTFSNLMSPYNAPILTVLAPGPDLASGGTSDTILIGTP